MVSTTFDHTGLSDNYSRRGWSFRWNRRGKCTWAAAKCSESCLWNTMLTKAGKPHCIFINYWGFPPLWMLTVTWACFFSRLQAMDGSWCIWKLLAKKRFMAWNIPWFPDSGLCISGCVWRWGDLFSLPLFISITQAPNTVPDIQAGLRGCLKLSEGRRKSLTK